MQNYNVNLIGYNKTSGTALNHILFQTSISANNKQTLLFNLFNKCTSIQFNKQLTERQLTNCYYCLHKDTLSPDQKGGGAGDGEVDDDAVWDLTQYTQQQQPTIEDDTSTVQFNNLEIDATTLLETTPQSNLKLYTCSFCKKTYENDPDALNWISYHPHNLAIVNPSAMQLLANPTDKKILTLEKWSDDLKTHEDIYVIAAAELNYFYMQNHNKTTIDIIYRHLVSQLFNQAIVPIPISRNINFKYINECKNLTRTLDLINFTDDFKSEMNVSTYDTTILNIHITNHSNINVQFIDLILLLHKFQPSELYPFATLYIPYIKTVKKIYKNAVHQYKNTFFTKSTKYITFVLNIPDMMPQIKIHNTGKVNVYIKRDILQAKSFDINPYLDNLIVKVNQFITYINSLEAFTNDLYEIPTCIPRPEWTNISSTRLDKIRILTHLKAPKMINVAYVIKLITALTPFFTVIENIDTDKQPFVFFNDNTGDGQDIYQTIVISNIIRNKLKFNRTSVFDEFAEAMIDADTTNAYINRFVAENEQLIKDMDDETIPRFNLLERLKKSFTNSILLDLKQIIPDELRIITNLNYIIDGKFPQFDNIIKILTKVIQMAIDTNPHNRNAIKTVVGVDELVRSDFHDHENIYKMAHTKHKTYGGYADKLAKIIQRNIRPTAWSSLLDYLNSLPEFTIDAMTEPFIPFIYSKLHLYRFNIEDKQIITQICTKLKHPNLQLYIHTEMQKLIQHYKQFMIFNILRQVSGGTYFQYILIKYAIDKNNTSMLKDIRHTVFSKSSTVDNEFLLSLYTQLIDPSPSPNLFYKQINSSVIEMTTGIDKYYLTCPNDISTADDLMYINIKDPTGYVKPEFKDDYAEYALANCQKSMFFNLSKTSELIGFKDFDITGDKIMSILDSHTHIVPQDRIAYLPDAIDKLFTGIQQGMFLRTGNKLSGFFKDCFEPKILQQLAQDSSLNSIRFLSAGDGIVARAFKDAVEVLNFEEQSDVDVNKYIWPFIATCYDINIFIVGYSPNTKQIILDAPECSLEYIYKPHRKACFIYKILRNDGRYHYERIFFKKNKQINVFEFEASPIVEYFAKQLEQNYIDAKHISALKFYEQYHTQYNLKQVICVQHLCYAFVMDHQGELLHVPVRPSGIYAVDDNNIKVITQKHYTIPSVFNLIKVFKLFNWGDYKICTFIDHEDHDIQKISAVIKIADNFQIMVTPVKFNEDDFTSDAHYKGIGEQVIPVSDDISRYENVHVHQYSIELYTRFRMEVSDYISTHVEPQNRTPKLKIDTIIQHVIDERCVIDHDLDIEPQLIKTYNIRTKFDYPYYNKQSKLIIPDENILLKKFINKLKYEWNHIPDSRDEILHHTYNVIHNKLLFLDSDEYVYII